MLCTNDDGYLSTGIGVLGRAASTLGSVTTVAPDREQSATSSSLTLHHPLRARRSRDGAWIVDGTPTDCVILAVNELVAERPDVCVSGVNHGSNLGEDVLYSGTVAAAMEATVIGIPAVAFSWCGAFPEELEECEELVARILKEILSRGDFPEDTLFNVNLPPVHPSDVKGIRVTSLGRRRYADSITRANDPSGNEYYWIGGGQVTWRGSEDSDFQAIDDGYVSVTPLHLDLTNYRLLEDVRAWDLTL
ncbi:MAG: 5'/3'-nucleotidase SurE [Gemmatimonadota bacterium]|nr:5'/3'-nucleotidase SurE [Gemmatimonadota bacterium]MDE3005076.1 5'/3'-nucleotidase SurE [Gemmatimonadota bacterium]MDE3013812.1 5'/3'-nucleotidase SurE [Gemmatimonadota bacterium]